SITCIAPLTSSSTPSSAGVVSGLASMNSIPPSSGSCVKPSAIPLIEVANASSSTSVTVPMAAPPAMCCQIRTGEKEKPTTLSTVSSAEKAIPASSGSSSTSTFSIDRASGSCVMSESESFKVFSAYSAPIPPMLIPATVVPAGTRSERNQAVQIYAMMSTPSTPARIMTCLLDSRRGGPASGRSMVEEDFLPASFESDTPYIITGTEDIRLKEPESIRRIDAQSPGPLLPVSLQARSRRPNHGRQPHECHMFGTPKSLQCWLIAPHRCDSLAGTAHGPVARSPDAPEWQASQRRPALSLTLCSKPTWRCFPKHL